MTNWTLTLKRQFLCFSNTATGKKNHPKLAKVCPLRLIPFPGPQLGENPLHKKAQEKKFSAKKAPARAFSGKYA